MSSIVIASLSWHLPDGTPLFENLDLTFGPVRTGLVGRNGIGKTTLLRLIAGEIAPTAGKVTSPGSMGFLCQNPEQQAESTLADLFGVQEQLAILARAAAGAATEADLAKADWSLEQRLEMALTNTGLDRLQLDAPLGSLSGGQRTRAGLAALMFAAPDVLLLDEPTNHLDLETIEWLETYLKGVNTPMVIVSHDREFLDRLCTQIVETERGVSTTYLGNYSKYLEQKAENRLAQLSAYERQQKDIAQQQAYIDRFRASATRSTQAKSREKQLNKVERIEAPESDVRTLKFQFPPAPRSGEEVVVIEEIGKASCRERV